MAIIIGGIVLGYIVFSYIAMFIMVGNPFKGSDIPDAIARALFFMAPILAPRMIFNSIFSGKKSK